MPSKRSRSGGGTQTPTATGRKEGRGSIRSKHALTARTSSRRSRASPKKMKGQRLKVYGTFTLIARKWKEPKLPSAAERNSASCCPRVIKQCPAARRNGPQIRAPTRANRKSLPLGEESRHVIPATTLFHLCEALEKANTTAVGIRSATVMGQRWLRGHRDPVLVMQTFPIRTVTSACLVTMYRIT